MIRTRAQRWPRHATLALTLTSLALSSRPVAAEPTLELRVSGPKEVFPGDPQSASVDAAGRITLGLESALLGALGNTPIVAMELIDGVLYLGTAGGGLHRLDPRAKNARRLVEDDKALVSAIAARGGRIYFATSPEGRVYRLGPKNEKEAFANPSTKYVWSLVPAKDGFYAATGDPGRVVHIDEKGATKVLFDAEETHVRALIAHPDGGLVAGSGQKGIVLRLDPKGRSFALYDSELDEVTALAIDPKTQDVYAAFVSEAEKGKFLPGRSIGPVAEDKKDNGASPIKSSEVVRISKDGRVDVLFTSRREGALDLAFDPEKRLLYVVTGGGSKDRGRVYAVDTRDRDRLLLLARVEQPLASALELLPGGGVLVGSAPAAEVLRFGPAPARASVYLSEEQDLRRPARLGRIWFDADLPAGSKLSLFLRSGNTAKVGPSWSDWSRAVGESTGGAIELPRGRYVQFKAELTASPKGLGPTLKSMHASVHRANVAPELKEVFLLRPGIYMRPMPGEEEKEKTITVNTAQLQRLRSASTDREDTRVRQGQKPGWLTAAWEAADRNGDAVLSRVELRALDGERPGPWQVLQANTRHGFHSFDSRAFPDGRYQLRVVVSDRPANPPEEALTDERESEPFTIDNEPPRIEGLQAVLKDGTLEVTLKATDRASILGGAEVSVAGGPWLMLPAADGLTDAREETFLVRLRPDGKPGSPKFGRGRQSVAVRVSDEVGNESSASTFFTVP